MKILKQVLLVVFIPMFSLCVVGRVSSKNKLLLSHTPTLQIKQPRSSQKQNLALFDTSQTNQYCYKPTLEIAQANNFTVIYYPVSKIIDTPIDTISYDTHDCAFFILCPEFLRTMQTSPIAKKILSIIKRFSQIPHKIIGVMLPSMKPTNKNPMSMLASLFNGLGTTIFPYTNNTKQKIMFLHMLNHFLQSPLECRSLPYHTTLRMPGGKTSCNFLQAISNDTIPIALLPIKQHDTFKKISKMLPFGIYWFNNIQRNHWIIGNANILSFSGITENFQICPMKFDMRKHFHEAVNEMIWETYQIAKQNKSIPGVNTQNILCKQKAFLPLLLRSLGEKTHPTHDTKSQDLHQV